MPSRAFNKQINKEQAVEILQQMINTLKLTRVEYETLITALHVLMQEPPPPNVAPIHGGGK